MSQAKPEMFTKVADMIEAVIRKVGNNIVFGMPLGLGKPKHIANELYRRAKEDSNISLTIMTALSLEKPSWGSDLERRFLEPFVERVFGGYPDLDYVKDLRAGKIPDNITLKEFYFKPGGFLNVPSAQQNYISSNYTHVARDTIDNGINVAGQIIRRGEVDGRRVYSLSCNPEVSFDLVPGMRAREEQGYPVAILGETNQNLPFMYGDAVAEPDQFDMILEAPEYNFRLFGTPKMPVLTPDYMIGLGVSSLIKDGGTIQIGIGSLGDALVYALKLRQEANDDYKSALEKSLIGPRAQDFINRIGGTDTFKEGLLGSTEMLVDGYLHLYNAGIVKRKTYNNCHIQRMVNSHPGEDVTPETLESLLDLGAVSSTLNEADVDFLKEYGVFRPDVELDNGELRVNGQKISADLTVPSEKNKIFTNCLGDKLKNGIIIHGGFFLGPESFYKALNDMSEEERKQIFMTTVQNVNQLYGNEELKLLQRKQGRFCNAGLMVTLSGAVVSDGLENEQVVSGVGGQYNFVSMAHALPDARSILMIRAVRQKGAEVKSNVVYNYGHTTIPRHLRDIVVTEYGIAELRGKSDWEVIANLLKITDSRFQDELLAQAKSAGKIHPDYRIPDKYKNNLPERIEDDLKSFKEKGLFQPFPFGTDFTDEELVIGKAIKTLKAKMETSKIPIPNLAQARKMLAVPPAALPYLERLQLDKPQGAKEKMLQRLVVYALASIDKV